MAFNIFGKNKKEDKKPAEAKQVEVVEKASVPVAVSQGAHEVIRNLYTSEKSTRLLEFNQYIFKVTKHANKQQVKKHVGALYNVKVTNVQMLNMPEKERRIGKHPGVKSGFRKAIVTLAKGQTIDQARP